MRVRPAKLFNKISLVNLLGTIAIVLASFLRFLPVAPAYALSPFAEAAIVHARLQTSIAANTSGNFILIAVKTAAGEAGGQTTAVVTFGAGYTVNATNTNITTAAPGVNSCPTTYDITGTGVQATLTSWPGVGATASSVSGQQVTFASTALSASTVYGFCITGGVTNPASTGVQSNTVTANNDSTAISTYFISNDQVTVTATVPTAFTFTLSGNTDSLGTLSTSSVSTSTTGVTAQMITNSASGYSIQLKSTNRGLHSNTANHTITSTANAAIQTLTAGTEGFLVAVTSKTVNNTGTAAVGAKFDATGGGSANGGDVNNTGYQELAYANNTTTNDSYVFKERAAISSTTAGASDYTDIFTVVGSGNF